MWSTFIQTHFLLHNRCISKNSLGEQEGSIILYELESATTTFAPGQASERDDTEEDYEEESLETLDIYAGNK